MSPPKIFLESTSEGFRFVNEAALEDFVWLHLADLFGCTPLQRQYGCSGEVCDILAIAPDRRLVVVELKNTEDRYIIQQLTRYYANLIDEQPFSDQVDYRLPVRLVAIAPVFHRHNRIDQQHSRLDFELWQFTVEAVAEQPWLQLSDLEAAQTVKLPIPYQAVSLPQFDDVPPPPDKLMTWLSHCTPQEQAGFLLIRAALLSRGKRMQEWVDGNWVRYGSGKTKRAAEFGYRPNLRKLILFVWLPTPVSSRWILNQANPSKKPAIGRLRLWTDGDTFIALGHVTEGYGQMRTREEWAAIPPDKRPLMMESGSHRSRTPVGIKYYALNWQAEPPSDYWAFIAERLVETWNRRV
jgi:RecB family endonuclease NucS